MTYRNSHTSTNYGRKYADSYKTGYNEKQWILCEKPLLEKIISRYASTTKCLDFACGTGRITSVLESHFENIVGIDISETMLEEASKTLEHTKLKRHNLLEENMPDSFDLITSFRFFTNAEKELSLPLMQKLRETINSDGLLIINFHRNSTGLLSKMYKFRGIDESDESAKFRGLSYAEYLLDEAGFEIIEQHWYSFLPKSARYPSWVLSALLGPVDKVLQMLPNRLSRWSQCFILVCKPK